MSVVISQFDVVTGYGWGLDALWNGLLSNQTAIHPTDRFEPRHFISNQAAHVPGLKVPPGTSRVVAMLMPLLGKLVGNLDPQTPIILATTVGEIEIIESAVLDNQPHDVASRSAPSVLLAQIKQHLGLSGPAMVVSSACASSTAALAHAAAMVDRGESPAVLVVACDAISEFVYAGFSTLQSLCETPARPFDAGRCGLSLGEAAAWALVTTSAAAAQADAVCMLGWASTSDAIHMTAPDRTALGLSRAIKKACTMANRTPEEIAFIAAHGTATVYSDAMELLAFRGAVPKPIPIFSVKGGTGHTLGAAGLMQILVSARALCRGQTPPTVGLSHPDASAAGWVHAVPVSLNHASVALSTNSGFGGVNTAIILGRLDQSRQQTIRATAPKPVIRAVAYSLCQESPQEITALVGRPVKYLSRMTPETRCCLVAGCKALRALNLEPGAEIGIVSAGEAGFLKADAEYFHDYVGCGRSMARGNLFIYTLPTSAASEVAIALGLRGPTLYGQADAAPVKSLITFAGQVLVDSGVQAILALWSGPKAAICFAITLNGEPTNLAQVDWDLDPLEMANSRAAAERP